MTTRKFFKIRFLSKKRVFSGFAAFSDSLERDYVPLTFPKKLKKIRFPSIKSFKSVVWPFWCYRKIALSLENISHLEHTWEVSRKDFTSYFQKSYFYVNPIFLGKTDGHLLKKEDFQENMTFKNESENFLYTCQIFGLGIWNVLQTQGYLSVTSEWSYDTFERFYRLKIIFSGFSAFCDSLEKDYVPLTFPKNWKNLVFRRYNLSKMSYDHSDVTER